MKKGFIIYSIASVITALAVTSCTDDSEQYSSDKNGVFRLSSGQEAFTRAEKTFAVGTAYQLYAIEGTNFGTNYLKDPAASGVVTGTEQDDHTIGGTANKFNNKTLNFYGVTNSTSTPVTIIESGNIPTSSIQYNGSEPLTDVMWAEVKNQTYLNSGTITLPFKHTLAKLNLFVLKNEEVTSATLQGITLKDYATGTLSMLTGTYATDDNDKRDHEVTVLDNVNITVTNEAAEVTDGGNAIAPMVFPTRKFEYKDIANHALRISVQATINGQAKNQETQITSLLAEEPQAPEIPFNFKPNYEYDVVITITNKSLVVTIVPRVYDWIPEDNVMVDSDVNGSMTIGGLTWMDRNLGATSGDPLAGDQAWENSRGFYYEFRRNIPYYIKTKTDANGIVYAPSNGNWHRKESMPYPYIPGHMNDAPTTESGTPAVYPYDPSDYNFKFIYNDVWNNSSDRSQWGNTDSPCPKGWRIPTKDEFQLIIPIDGSAGDIPFNLHNGNTYEEEKDSDPESGSKSTYIGVKKDIYETTNVGISNSIYALKKQGTNNAYYLRWHIERSGEYKIPNDNNTADKGDPYRNVLVISRYPATRSSTLTKENVYSVVDWKYPVEQIKLPISGYIHRSTHGSDVYEGNTQKEIPALIYSGTEAVYWTSTTRTYKGSTYAYTVRMKFAGDSASSQIMMYDSEIFGNGCLIRCVRDTQAK